MLLIRFSLAILDTFGLDDESSPSSRMPDCRYDEVLFVDGATVAKDRVRKIRDRKAIGSNYSFGPHLPLSFLLLFFLLTEIERGRVRKIDQKAIRIRSIYALVRTLLFRCLFFCFSFC